MSVERTAEEPEAESKDSARQLDLLEEIGGPQGIADSSIPAIVFVAVYALGGNRISLAGICAIGAGLAIAALRLAKGESLRFVLAGFIGVAVAAFIADRTGRAEDFFLPGLLLNAVYGSAYVISILIRWPLLGVILGPTLGGEGMSWRKNPQQLRVYSRASWVWVGVFATRLAVQLPFYLAGSLVALGIARTAMGLPIFALAIWLSYVILKRGGIEVPELFGSARGRVRRLAPEPILHSGDRGKGTACGAAERLGSSQFDYAQEEQKDPGDNGRDEQRAATAEPVGEEDEHDNRME